jgi:hypothetical protein
MLIKLIGGTHDGKEMHVATHIIEQGKLHLRTIMPPDLPSSKPDDMGRAHPIEVYVNTLNNPLLFTYERTYE